jgi:hypothetical protein
MIGLSAMLKPKYGALLPPYVNLSTVYTYSTIEHFSASDSLILSWVEETLLGVSRRSTAYFLQKSCGPDASWGPASIMVWDSATNVLPTTSLSNAVAYHHSNRGANTRDSYTGS